MSTKNKDLTYEILREYEVEEIWEVNRINTYQGVSRLETALTKDLITARKIADDFKDRLENNQEVVVSLMRLENKEYNEVSGRILFSKRDNILKSTEDYQVIVVK